MNKNKWNSISPGDQKIIEQINQEWAEKQGALWDSYEKEAKDWVVSRGIKTIRLSDAEQAKWNAKADDYIKRMKDLSLPGDQLVIFVREQLKKAR
jgi:TRAP-type C4-dicarboxylate transport system substrate-binding protein